MQDSTTRYDLSSSNRRFAVDTVDGKDHIVCRLNGKEYRIVLTSTAPGVFDGFVNGKRVSVKIEDETASSITLAIDGDRMVFERAVIRPEKGEKSGSKAPLPREKESLASPMPGRVVAIKVKEGQKVASGDSLIVVESMKMETTLTSDRKGSIKELRVKEGDAIQRGQILMVYSD